MRRTNDPERHGDDLPHDFDLEKIRRELECGRQSAVNLVERIDNMRAEAEATVKWYDRALPLFPQREPSVWRVPLTHFQRKAYLDVDRGVLRDGEDGPIVTKDGLIVKPLRGLSRSSKYVLAHLRLNRGRIHFMVVNAFQMKDATATVAECKSRAEIAIAKLKKPFKGTCVKIGKPDGECHSPYTPMAWNGFPVMLSIDRADALAQDGEQALRAGDPAKAAQFFIAATEKDSHVLRGHEGLCEAAIELGAGRFEHVEQLKKTVRILGTLVERFGTCLSVFPHESALNTDDADAHLHEAKEWIQTQHDGWQQLVAEVRSTFESLFPLASRKDRRANEALRQLRALNLPMDQAMGHALTMSILKATCVERLLNYVEKRLPKNAGSQERMEARGWAGGMVLMSAIDPGHPLTGDRTCHNCGFLTCLGCGDV